MPVFVGCVSIRGNTNLSSHSRLKLVVGNFKESEKLPHQNTDVAIINQHEAEVERSSPDANVGIAQTFQDRIAVPLHGIGLNCHHLVQRVKSDLADIVVLVGQELSENVDTQHSQP